MKKYIEPSEEIRRIIEENNLITNHDGIGWGVMNPNMIKLFTAFPNVLLMDFTFV